MWANREVADFLAWLHAWNLGPAVAATRRLLRTRRLLAVGLLARDHLVARGPRTRRAAGRDAGVAVLRPVPGGPAPLRLEHPAGAGVVRARRRRPAGRGTPPHPASRRRRGRVRRGPERRGRGGCGALLPDHGARRPRRRGTSATTTWPTRSTGLARRSGPGVAGGWSGSTTPMSATPAPPTCRAAGLVNVGQLVRERHATDGVALVGFASHRGSVVAADAWGDPGARPPGARRRGGQPRGPAPSGPGRLRRRWCSERTGRGPGSRRGEGTGRSASSTTPGARRATTCPRVMGGGTTRSSGSRRPPRCSPSVTRHRRASRSSRPSRRASSRDQGR